MERLLPCSTRDVSVLEDAGEDKFNERKIEKMKERKCELNRFTSMRTLFFN